MENSVPERECRSCEIQVGRQPLARISLRPPSLFQSLRRVAVVIHPRRRTQFLRGPKTAARQRPQAYIRRQTKVYHRASRLLVGRPQGDVFLAAEIQLTS